MNRAATRPRGNGHKFVWRSDTNGALPGKVRTKKNGKRMFYYDNWIVVLLFLSLYSGVTMAEEEYDCENPLDYSFVCTQTSLCSSSDDFVAPSRICYRIKSCFFGICTTTDYVESEETDSVCELVEEGFNKDNQVCLDGWDSSWWMTDYIEAVDCDYTDSVYLNCSESVGDVPDSAVGMGFSAVLVAAAVATVWSRHRRRTMASISATELVPASNFERLA